jgi:hypothetical protein
MTTHIKIGLNLLALAFLMQAESAAQQQSATEREAQLLSRIDQLERRLAALETKAGIEFKAAADTQPIAAPALAPSPAPDKDAASLPGFVAGTTINAYLDGYFGFNFNRPIGRVNLLRSNDVLANNFTLNQADVVIERAPDASAGRRLGMRVDLMFGENTETFQGGAQNEPRPQVYRNIFQAYGTYIAPLGSGLQLDFGKFASSLGIENNYAKDQINYSRSYYFNYLPFYHMGVRATYKINDKLSAQYWIVNGANQTETFNNYKSQAFLFTISPTKSISWNVNYYFGEEGRDVVPDYNPVVPTLATQPGLSTTPVSPVPNGREHIFDTYINWNATSKLTLAAEADYVVNRSFQHGQPAHVIGGAGYAKYQFTNFFALGGRFEYLSDRGGLFSGTTQALKEGTITGTFQPVDGFQIRTEMRTDFSNQAYFLTAIPNQFKRQQTTATVGLIWWFGGKQGAW